MEHFTYFRIGLLFTFQNYNTIACDFIIKVALVGDSANSLNELNVYDKEMEMYEKILPQLKTLLHKAGANRKIFADTIYVSKPHKAILFEDLSIKGYRSKSGKDGFDMQHAKAILSRLAKFHGAAAVLQEQQPDIFKNFQHGMNAKNGLCTADASLNHLSLSLSLF